MVQFLIQPKFKTIIPKHNNNNNNNNNNNKLKISNIINKKHS